MIEMDQVPKVLKTMVDEWSNEGFVVSFKVSCAQFAWIYTLLPRALAHTN